jgi:hypothetical protein
MFSPDIFPATARTVMTQTANRNVHSMRFIVAYAVLAVSSLVSGIAAAAGAPQSQIAVTATVVRPPVPVVRIIDAQSNVVANAPRQETASSRANGVQHVLVEY